MNIYESCPVLESERFLLRFIQKEDCGDLLKVYSDKNALPFFNSDNCHGDNFYYPTIERMAEAMDFWFMSYRDGWFVRFSIVDKATSAVIGTIEVLKCESDDSSDGMCIIRLDVRSDFEKEDVLFELFSLINPRLSDMLGCYGAITKAPIYAVERIDAVKKAGFTPLDEPLVRENGKKYYDYWVWIKK